jgi:hypothetical protein
MSCLIFKLFKILSSAVLIGATLLQISPELKGQQLETDDTLFILQDQFYKTKHELHVLDSLIRMEKLHRLSSELWSIGLPKGADQIQPVEKTGLIFGIDTLTEKTTWSFHKIEMGMGWDPSAEASLNDSTSIRMTSIGRVDTNYSQDFRDTTFIINGEKFTAEQLIPAADVRWNKFLIENTYLSENFFLLHEKQQETWNRLENGIRNLGFQLKRKLFVATGMVYRENTENAPDILYKAISTFETDPIQFAVSIKNTSDHISSPLSIISLDSLSQLSGITFFKNLGTNPSLSLDSIRSLFWSANEISSKVLMAL